MNRDSASYYPGWMPRSLRWQFRLAMMIFGVLIATGSLIALLALRQSVNSIQQLAGERLVQMEFAQELGKTAMQIELETHHLLAATSKEKIEASYTKIISLMDKLDQYTEQLGSTNDDIQVLAMYQAEQIFRNIIHIVVALRTIELQGDSPSWSGNKWQRFSSELEHQATAVTSATDRLAANGRKDYQRAVQILTVSSEKSRGMVRIVFIVSMITSWLFFYFILEKHVLARLIEVSRYLLWNEVQSVPVSIPVESVDEIGSMARSVELFIEDRRQLAITNRRLQHTNDMLRGILEAAPTAIIDFDLRGNAGTVWNKAAEKMLGWKAEEMAGRTLPLDLDKKEAFNLLLEKLGKGMTLNGLELQWQRRDGSPIDYSIYASPLRDDNGVITGSIAVMVDISERKQMEINLLETKNRLSAVINTIPDLIWFKDTKGVYLACNPEFERFFGAPESEIIGRTDYDFVSHSQAEFFRKKDREAISTGKLCINEEEVTYRSDGHYAILETRKVPVLNSEGNVLGILGIGRDITERVNAEQALKESESRFRILYESTPAMMYSMDTSGQIIYVSNTLLSNLGYDREEIIGHKPIEFMTEESNRFAIESAFPEFLRKGQCSNVPYQVAAKSGEILDILLSAISERDADDRITQIFAVLQDVTRHNRDQRRIEKLVAEQKAILETELVGITTVKDHLFVWVNPAFERMFGYDPGELAGTPTRNIYPNGESYLSFINTAYPALLSGKVYRSQKEFLRKDGEAVWLDISASILNQESGESVWAFVDITELRQAELQLRAAKEIAESASRSKSTFLANMSHEIRTPMNAVMGLTQLLMGTELKTHQKDYLVKLNTSAKSLLGIINDILDYSKIEAGKIELESVEFELEEILENTVSLFSVSAEEKSLELIFDVASDIPQYLVGDPLRLRQIINNLLGNAIKFTSHGHVCISFKVSEQKSDKLILEVEVADTGIGMTPEQMEKLFVAFEQADASTTRKYGGTGLGLTITKRLVKLMGGEISVRSIAGYGSTFSFRVPVKITEARDEKRYNVENLCSMKTLVVEEHEVFSEVLAKILTSWKFRVDIAGTAKEGFNMAEVAESMGDSYELVMIDWKLPDMRGIEFAKQLKRSEDSGSGRIKYKIVMMISSLERKEASLMDIDVHFDAILDKPVMTYQLFNTLAGLQDLKSGRKDAARLEVRLHSSKTCLKNIHGAKVLLVEDNVTNQLIARRLLENMGLSVVIANNGSEAIAQVVSTSVDLILMDLQMPVMDGIDATKRIRTLPQGKDIPIIAMTAAAMPADREASRKAGMNGFVAKPIDLEELTTALRSWIRPREVQVIKRVTPSVGQNRNTPGGKPFTLPGLNIQKAAERMGMDWNLLRIAMYGFRHDFSDSAAELDQLIYSQSWRDAERLVHTIKGMANSIGADELYNIAYQLECELKLGKHETQQNFQASLNQTLQNIAALPEQESKQKSADVTDTSRLPQLLAQLRQLLERSGYIAPELLEELKQYMSDTDQLNKFDNLSANIMAFDYSSALISLPVLASICNVHNKE